MLLPVFTRKAKRKLISHQKFYYFDTGVFRAIRPIGPMDSDAEMDGVFAQGIVIQNNSSDDDKFSNKQTQTNKNFAANAQKNKTFSGAYNKGSATGGDAYDAKAKGKGGDAGSIALGFGIGGDAKTKSTVTGGTGGVTDTAGNPLASTVTSSFTTAAVASTTYSLFNNTGTPAISQ